MKTAISQGTTQTSDSVSDPITQNTEQKTNSHLHYLISKT